jgi:hypothetical protein
MPVSKEQWKEVEKQLSGIFGSVVLRCDGYEVLASVEGIGTLRQGIAVYVNGWIKGEWMGGEAEEARKFHRAMKRYLYSEKQRDEARKKAKSRRLPAEIRNWYEGVATRSVSTWAPYWTNAQAFTRHLRKMCADIQVVRIGHQEISS